MFSTALVLLHGIVQKPELDMFLATSHENNDWTKDFPLNICCLHFFNNNSISAGLSKARPSFRKIKPDFLVHLFSIVNILNENSAADESLMLFKGQFSAKQYLLANEASRFHLKL